MFSILRRRKCLTSLARTVFSPVRSLHSNDKDWPWPWWEKELPRVVKEKEVEWTPVIVITNISFHSGFKQAETRLAWWRSECDG